MASSAREENVDMAKLSEQTERYEEIVEFMEKVSASLSDTEELTVEECNLLSVAYKDIIGDRRASWRIISSIEQKEESHGNQDHVSVIKHYRSKIEKELSDICGGILKLLDSKLVPSASSGDSKPRRTARWISPKASVIPNFYLPVHSFEVKNRTSTDEVKSLRLITAIKTPYIPDGRFDLEAYDALVHMPIKDGADGIIVGGTTGEGQLMSSDEHIMLIGHTINCFGTSIKVKTPFPYFHSFYCFAEISTHSLVIRL
ncbi:hypothetical protein L1987_03681 [Smallanthus sonchifolius]|uniref:Uncharacterized protein n=1 Tax=Smallanthus sonchifolius TaxID=185202 RepID=A0ACB9KBH3_9ASTR|nr:hypothetical protein L1987_03681 [Smallanthus sonchifolius]